MATLLLEHLATTVPAALAPVRGSGRCALLDFPDFLNVGDHLLWIAAHRLLENALGYSIAYAASQTSFSADELRRRVDPGVPVFLAGGGSLGDLYEHHQLFRERVVEALPDRPIVILPQAIHFQDPARCERARLIFGRHPDLTVFTRDRVSFARAQRYFPNARTFLAPDIALYLAKDRLTLPRSRSAEILALMRDDIESGAARCTSPSAGCTIEDWRVFAWPGRRAGRSVWAIPGAGLLARELWVRRLGDIGHWRRRRRWLRHGALARRSTDDRVSSLYQRSQELAFEGLAQLAPYRIVLSDRLHGHIAALLLEKPSLLIANNYHKNEAFYQTWLEGHPGAGFAPSLDAALAQIESGRFAADA